MDIARNVIIKKSKTSAKCNNATSMQDKENRLIKIKKSIEKMDNSHHPDFVKIIEQHNVEYSQNRSGSFITLNLLDEETLKKIENHINLINTQNKDFENVETIKKNIEDNYPNLKTTE